MAMTEGRALFVLPSTIGNSASIVSPWLAAAQWSEALRRRFGATEILTPYGVLTPEEVAARAVVSSDRPSSRRTVARSLPRPARVAAGDVRAIRLDRSMRARAAEMSGRAYDLVVQLHHRFQTSGATVARSLGVPFVLRVEALEVQEERAWGVPRPGWGRAVERSGEKRILGRADRIASVSAELDEQLGRLGVAAAVRRVVPNGVDLDAFAPGPADHELLATAGLHDRFVVGWVGGFRPFHGLELLAEVAKALPAAVPNGVMCLVGTGPLQQGFYDSLGENTDRVHLSGAVPHVEMPRWVRSFDVCLLVSPGGRFHYSPLKLLEYLACGRAVVAPDVPSVRAVVTDGVDALLVPPGDPRAVIAAITRLHDDSELRAAIGTAGRAAVERAGSWDARLAQMLEGL